jgi:tetratricopeptide (TPR) repeat protein
VARALETGAGSAELQLAGARVLAGAHEWDRAEQAFERALQLAPGATAVLTEWARALARDGRLGDAAARLGRAVEVEPWNVAHRVALARMEVARGRLDDAETAARAALAVAPEDPSAANALALVEAARQRWEPAAATAQAALGREPSAEGHHVLARIAEGRGQLTAAVRHLRDALGLDPRRDELRRAWRELLARVGSSFGFATASAMPGLAAPALAAAPAGARGPRWIMHEQDDARVLLSESTGGEVIASVEARGRPVEGAEVILLEQTAEGRHDERASGVTDDHGEVSLGLAPQFPGLLAGRGDAGWRVQVALPPASADAE